MPLINLKAISLAFGGPPLLDAVELQIDRAERICLLGRNGMGKTTLLRLLGGDLSPNTGEILRQPGLRVALLPQELPEGIVGSCHEVVAAGFAAAGLPQPDAGQSHRIDHAITRAGLDPAADYSVLSTGNKRRTLIARAMVTDPDLLLLDEPTNHLDIDAIAALEAELKRVRTAILFVTHDRAFLRALATRVVELDRGRLHDFPGDYDAFLKRRDLALEAEASRNDKFDKKLAEEEAWLRQGIKARRTRNEGRVRDLQRLREERRARRSQAGDAQLRLQETERTGRQVIRAKSLNFAWGETVIAKDFSTRISRGDKIGILGPNGSGKTTLLRLLLGELEPQAGEVSHGSKLRIAYFDQRREQLDESRSVQDNIADGADSVIIDGRQVHIVTYLKQFLFSAEQARSPLSHLSGGERNRLLLARLFTRPANVLVLDEPTNDLDVETVELLEELLVEFKGTLLLVSHDREFLDNVTTSTLVLEGHGRVAETVGGYSDWARSRPQAEAKPRTKATKRSKPSVDKIAKLSWKERRELSALPAEIEIREDELAKLHAKLGEPTFYRSAGGEVAAAKTRLAGLASELEKLYERWQELSAREEL